MDALDRLFIDDDSEHEVGDLEEGWEPDCEQIWEEVGETVSESGGSTAMLIVKM